MPAVGRCDAEKRRAEPGRLILNRVSSDDS